MNTGTVLFIISGILWTIIGVGVGMLWESRRSPHKRRAALETGLVERRKPFNDLVVMVTPAWRLFVREAGGSVRSAYVEDRKQPVEALVDLGCSNLALKWQPPPRVAPPPPTPDVPRVLLPEGGES